ncbi:MAG: sigma-70 family RNA polymerase sigma factor [Blastocatellia bacterium]
MRDEITNYLVQWSNGDQSALDKIMATVYDELHQIAHNFLQNERPDHTLQTTALVNEAYLRLINFNKIDWKNRAHFFGIAGQIMRNILIDHARKQQANKRFNPNYKLSLDSILNFPIETDSDLIALDEALTNLEKVDPRQSRIIELRFFAGLTIDEVAEILDLSPATIKREWETAKFWLLKELRNQK